MAFYSILRRASSTSLPLAIRNIGSRKALSSAISTVLLAERSSIGHGISRQSLLSLYRFSTATNQKPSADSSLLSVIHSEIECAEEPKDAYDVPDGFPFEIHDNAGKRTILLTRQFEDETVKVEVDIPHVSVDEEEDDDDDDNAESAHSPSIPLVVNVSKASGKCLEFGITAFPDEISIDSLSIRNPESADDQLAYEGPDFNDLDENLQRAFHKYLEIRGIKPSTTNFLFEYMQNKDHKEYVQWLENLRDFVEK